MGCCISSYFCISHHASLLFFFSRAISIRLFNWNLMLSNHSSPCTTNIGTLQILRGTNLPFQEVIVSRNKQRTWKMYFFEVRIYHHFLNGMLHKYLFFYFPPASVLLSFSRAISTWHISWNLMLFNPSYRV